MSISKINALKIYQFLNTLTDTAIIIWLLNMRNNSRLPIDVHAGV